MKARKLVRELTPGDLVIGPIYERDGRSMFVSSRERARVVACVKVKGRVHRIDFVAEDGRTLIVHWASATSVGEVTS